MKGIRLVKKISRQKGSMTVFLCLILVPVMLVTCIVPDAARIYAARTVISDAGYMAMNTGLAQYQDDLMDEYGLMATSESIDSLEESMHKAFTETLTSKGITDSTDYQTYLGLLEESFEALSVQNAKLYQTEAERQQIVEYMKYRAPVCLTELVIDKLDQIKNTGQMCETVNAELEFTKAMENCQEAFEEALEALEKLNQELQEYSTEYEGSEEKDLNYKLDQLRSEYTFTGGQIPLYTVMRAAVCLLENRTGIAGDVEEAVTAFISAAKEYNKRRDGALKGVGYDWDSYLRMGVGCPFDEYIRARTLQQDFIASGGVEGLRALIPEKPQPEVEPPDMNKIHEAFADEKPERDEYDTLADYKEALKDWNTTCKDAYDEWKEAYNAYITSDEYKAYIREKTRIERLIKQYNDLKTDLETYADTLMLGYTKRISDWRGYLVGLLESAKTIKEYSHTSTNHLVTVKEKLLAAKEAYDNWDSSTSKLEEVAGSSDGLSEAAQGMRSQVDQYREFFGGEDGTNNDSIKALENLMAAVEYDDEHFSEISERIPNIMVCEVSYCDKLIEDNFLQGKAIDLLRETVSDMSEVDSDQARHLALSLAEYFTDEDSQGRIRFPEPSKGIDDDAFMIKLRSYCEYLKTVDESSNEDTKKANQTLNEGAEGAKKANADQDEEDPYPEYQWPSEGLPSLELQKLKEQNEKDSTLVSDNNVASRSKRRDTVDKSKDSITNNAGILAKIEQVILTGLEDVYIAEYGMQYFSCYTSNKEENRTSDGGYEIKKLESDQTGFPMTLSGYPMNERPAYRAEIEYILWGNTESEKNIRNTMALLYGVRFLFNSIYALTDKDLVGAANKIAVSVASGAPYLVPVVQTVTLLGVAAVESAKDLKALKRGYGVAVIKTKGGGNFETQIDSDGLDNDVRTGKFRMDYQEYLRVFLFIETVGKSENALARIADCIQVNLPDTDILECETMVGVNASVKVNTVFLRKSAEEAGSGRIIPDAYTIDYVSVLGY